MLKIETFPCSILQQPLTDARGRHPWRAVAVSASDPAILFDIKRPEVSLVVWDRVVPELLVCDIQPLLQTGPFTAVGQGSPASAVVDLSKQAPAPLPPELLLDILDLALSFEILSEAQDPLHVCLQAVVHQECDQWHTDAVGLRMLCTYRGACLEWLSLDGGAAMAHELNNTTFVPPPGLISSGAVALLKGDHYPGNAKSSCIHRAPSTGSGCGPYLRLCIDQQTEVTR